MCFCWKKNNSRKKENQIKSTIVSSKHIDINDDEKFIVNALVDNVQFEVDKVFDQSKSTSTSIYYLINWKSYEKFDQTWEFYEHIAHLKVKFKSFEINQIEKLKLSNLSRNEYYDNDFSIEHKKLIKLHFWYFIDLITLKNLNWSLEKEHTCTLFLESFCFTRFFQILTRQKQKVYYIQSYDYN